MNDPSKIKPVHTQRAALVYVRQSSLSQVEHNRESTARPRIWVVELLPLPHSPPCECRRIVAYSTSCMASSPCAGIAANSDS